MSQVDDMEKFHEIEELVAKIFFSKKKWKNKKLKIEKNGKNGKWEEEKNGK